MRPSCDSQGKLARYDLRVVLGFQLAITILVATVVTVVGVPLGQAGALAAIMTWSFVIDSGRAPTAIPLEREMNYRLVLQAEVIEVIAWNGFAVAAVAVGFGVWGVAAAQIVRAHHRVPGPNTPQPAGLRRTVV